MSPIDLFCQCGHFEYTHAHEKKSRKYTIKKKPKKNQKKTQFSRITKCDFRAVSTLLTTLLFRVSFAER